MGSHTANKGSGSGFLVVKRRQIGHPAISLALCKEALKSWPSTHLHCRMPHAPSPSMTWVRHVQSREAQRARTWSLSGSVFAVISSPRKNTEDGRRKIPTRVSHFRPIRPGSGDFPGAISGLYRGSSSSRLAFLRFTQEFPDIYSASARFWDGWASFRSTKRSGRPSRVPRWSALATFLSLSRQASGRLGGRNENMIVRSISFPLKPSFAGDLMGLWRYPWTIPPSF